ncbi:hypothetical protein MRX96_045468 [Rhipicephalus microplus]
MQTRLLELPNPSLVDVVKAALAMDAATKDANEIARVASTEAAASPSNSTMGLEAGGLQPTSSFTIPEKTWGLMMS